MQIKKLLFLLLTLVLGYVVYSNVPRSYSVILGENGYSPENLKIKKGDIVTFSTSLNMPFWPASDPHPLHSNYSDFDPKKGIKNGESWSFRFKNSGNFSYHDHLNASLRGNIRVIETNPLITLSKKILRYKNGFEIHNKDFLARVNLRCQKPSFEHRLEFITCWNNFLSGVTRDFGPTVSMNVLKQVKDEGFVTEGDCHTFADQIGTEAYWKYIGGQKFPITDELGICYNGFMHGFMLEHMSHGQDLRSSEDFCNSISTMDPSIVRECFSGLGTGLAYYFWGVKGQSPEVIVKNSIGDCNKLSSSNAREGCAYGVFGGMEHLYLGVHGSTLKISSDHPFSICEFSGEKDLQRNCYLRLIGPLFESANYDAAKIANYIDIKDLVAKEIVIRQIGQLLASFNVYREDLGVKKFKENCRFFGDFYAACLGGAFQGIFMELGDKLKDFSCDLDFLDSRGRGICKKEKNDYFSK